MLEDKTLDELRQIIIDKLNLEPENPIRDAVAESTSLGELIAKMEWYYGRDEESLINAVDSVIRTYLRQIRTSHMAVSGTIDCSGLLWAYDNSFVSQSGILQYYLDNNIQGSG